MTPGPLTAEERALLDALLAHRFEGVEALRLQAQRAEAKQGCQCGCGTIDFVLSDDEVPRSTASSPVPVKGHVLGADGTETGVLLLFLNKGLLSSLEVASYDEPPPLPAADAVRWVVADE